MGGACSSVTAEQRQRLQRSRTLDTLLRCQDEHEDMQIQVLFVAHGSSGTRVLKHLGKMTNISDPPVCKRHRAWVFQRCIELMQAMLDTAAQRGIQVEEENREAATRVASLASEDGKAWSAEVAHDIKRLWADRGLLSSFKQRDEALGLVECAQHFFGDIDRLADPSYEPSARDVHSLLFRCGAVHEVHYEYHGWPIKVVDMSRKKHEFFKWKRSLAAMDVLLYCVPLTSFDEALPEDPSRNSMTEALLTFDEICNGFCRFTGMKIVLLTGLSAFKEKVQRVDLGHVFPDYTDGCTSDWEKPAAFIAEKFKTMCVDQFSFKSHFVDTSNAENLREVLEAVNEKMYREVPPCIDWE